MSLCGLACWTEPILSILPQRFCAMCGTTSLISRRVERRFTFICASKSSSVTSSNGARTCMEALATSMSAGQAFPSENFFHSAPASARARSNFQSSAFVPNFRALEAVCSASFSLPRKFTTTSAPNSARARVIARPMPCPPPVTSAVLPLRLNNSFIAFKKNLPVFSAIIFVKEKQHRRRHERRSQ